MSVDWSGYRGSLDVETALGMTTGLPTAEHRRNSFVLLVVDIEAFRRRLAAVCGAVFIVMAVVDVSINVAYIFITDIQNSHVISAAAVLCSAIYMIAGVIGVTAGSRRLCRSMVVLFGVVCAVSVCCTLIQLVENVSGLFQDLTSDQCTGADDKSAAVCTPSSANSVRTSSDWPPVVDAVLVGVSVLALVAAMSGLFACWSVVVCQSGVVVVANSATKARRHHQPGISMFTDRRVADSRHRERVDGAGDERRPRTSNDTVPSAPPLFLVIDQAT